MSSCALDAARRRRRRESADVGGRVDRNITEPALIGVSGLNANRPVDRIRAAILDDGLLRCGDADLLPLAEIDTQLQEVMGLYQASRFDQMVKTLPDLLTAANWAKEQPTQAKRRKASRLSALSHQAAAMVLTKLGEHDLAWIASQQGLTVAEISEQPAVIGSLRRSVVHSLQSHGRHASSAKLTERTADELRDELDQGDDESTSIYGTLLLAGSMAAARAGDKSTTRLYLDEASHHADQLTKPGNRLWTSFSSANVAVHRVATAVARDDISNAEKSSQLVDQSALPSERRVRYLFDLAMIAVRRDKADDAIAIMLDAEQVAPEQVHHHVMAQQIVGHLRGTRAGRQNPHLAQLDRRTRKSRATAAGR